VCFITFLSKILRYGGGKFYIILRAEDKYRSRLHNLLLRITCNQKSHVDGAMNMATKRPQQIYKVDLRKIDGEGDFPCPKCGTLISPDDESEEVYTIVDTKMREDVLEELIISCNKCGSKIHVSGFLREQ